jgi:hypothetical protein
MSPGRRVVPGGGRPDPFAEHDEARERSKAAKVLGLVAVLPLQLKIRDEHWHVDEVDWAVAKYLVRDHPFGSADRPDAGREMYSASTS